MEAIRAFVSKLPYSELRLVKELFIYAAFTYLQRANYKLFSD